MSSNFFLSRTGMAFYLVRVLVLVFSTRTNRANQDYQGTMFIRHAKNNSLANFLALSSLDKREGGE